MRLSRLGRLRQLSRWLLLGEWRAYPLRALTAVAAIALGVALGFAIDLINTAAYNEFSAAARSLSGQADLEVRGTQPTFDERYYPMLATRAGVAQASPMLELDAAVSGQTSPLKIIGVDVMRAAAMTPDLVGVPVADRPFDTLADDAVFLSPAAMAWLKTRVGSRIKLRVGTHSVSLRVAGGLVRARAGQRIGVMDIGAAQWRFQRIGQLSRVALKLTEGVNLMAFKSALARATQGQLQVLQSADETSRSASLSRAYRVNLNVLALVALFTGAFLVFSTQALSVIRRRSQFALLRVMGVTRTQLLRQVVLEGGMLGAVGAALGGNGAAFFRR
jgi:putative ABC transport system permease protein